MCSYTRRPEIYLVRMIGPKNRKQTTLPWRKGRLVLERTAVQPAAATGRRCITSCFRRHETSVPSLMLWGCHKMASSIVSVALLYFTPTGSRCDGVTQNPPASGDCSSELPVWLSSVVRRSQKRLAEPAQFHRQASHEWSSALIDEKVEIFLEIMNICTLRM